MTIPEPEVEDFEVYANQLIAEARKRLVKEEHMTPELEGRARYISIFGALRQLKANRKRDRQAAQFLVQTMLDERLLMYAEEEDPNDALVSIFEEVLDDEIVGNPSTGQLSEWRRIQEELIPAFRKLGMPLRELIAAFYSGSKNKLRASARIYTHTQITPMHYKRKEKKVREIFEKVVDPNVSIEAYETWVMKEIHGEQKRKRFREIYLYRGEKYSIIQIKLPTRWIGAFKILVKGMLEEGEYIPERNVRGLVEMLYQEKPLAVIRYVREQLGIKATKILEETHGENKDKTHDA